MLKKGPGIGVSSVEQRKTVCHHHEFSATNDTDAINGLGRAVELVDLHGDEGDIYRFGPDDRKGTPRVVSGGKKL